MSSPGIDTINSGPLIIRDYYGSSINNTYLLGRYDIPIPPNYVLITSTNGLLAPSNNIYVSSISVSSINGGPYPPIDDAFWSGSLAGNIYNDNVGNVGIGTSVPQYKLDVNGDINTDASLYISSNGAAMRFTTAFGKSYIESGSTFTTGSANKLLFTEIFAPSTATLTVDLVNSRVGVNNESPSWTVDIFGSTNITNILQVSAGANDALSTTGFMSQFIRKTTSDVRTVDYQVAAISTGFGSNIWQDSRYVYNSTDPSGLSQVWGIVTSSNITPVGPNIGDIHFYKSVYVDDKVGIGTTNPQAILHVVQENQYYSSDNPSIYTSPGVYTVSVPSDAIEMEFEMIGAGGPLFSMTTSGTGGYIKGVINVSAFQGQVLTIKVGQSGSIDTNTPSGASYIYIPTSGPLFVMTGAGGSGSGAGGSQYGGWGGGGTFVSNVAVGGDGQTSFSGIGGQGGQVGGGGIAGSCSGNPGTAGNGRPMVENYEEASGGISATNVLGGNGYTGGGSGCGGGGGSSYYNSLFTRIIVSYPGNTVPSNILPSYGRTSKNGYVSISFVTPLPTIVTNGAVGIGTTVPESLVDIRGSIRWQQFKTSSIVNTDPGISAWPNLYGKYTFVSGTNAITLTLPTGSDAPPEGTVLTLRNLMTDPASTITINGVYVGGGTLAANTYASYVFTTYSTWAGGSTAWVEF